MDTKIYNIDSINRNVASYPNSYDYNYTTPGSGDQNIPFKETNVIGIKILSIEIPNTVYYISSTRYNNTFILDGSTYTLADGSYTRSELMSAFFTSAVSPLLSGISFNVNNYSNIVDIVSTDASLHTIEFTTNSTGYPSFGEILGFGVGSFSILSDGSPTSGTSAMIVPQEQYFFLRLNNLGNIVNNSTNYVAKIIKCRCNDTGYNYTTSYEYITNNIDLLQPEDINGLKISLEDYKGALISLNGSNYSFTMELTMADKNILNKSNQYSEKVERRILQTRMLAYYDKESKNKGGALGATQNGITPQDAVSGSVLINNSPAAQSWQYSDQQGSGLTLTYGTDWDMYQYMSDTSASAQYAPYYNNSESADQLGTRLTMDWSSVPELADQQDALTTRPVRTF